ncbi:MAG: hypothetical protein RR548_04950 [Carnobacterium sp.]|uniref:hypothetical protein n=1 Tax=Carnobacterium sp. TaxID=48221 RepID=UPI002FC82DAD
MKLFRNGIVRDVSEERAPLMKKIGWLELDINGSPVYENSDASEKAIKELTDALTAKEAELKKLKAEGLPEAKNVTELLKQYAEAKGFDYGSASSGAGVLAKIVEFEK